MLQLHDLRGAPVVCRHDAVQLCVEVDPLRVSDVPVDTTVDMVDKSTS